MTASFFGLISSPFKSRVKVRWRMPIEESNFENFEKIGEIEKDETEEKNDISNDNEIFLNIGPLVSDLSNPTHVMSIGCVKDETSAYWMVDEWSAPDEAPPPSVLAATQKAGSYDAVCKMLAEILSGGTYVGEYEVRIYLPEQSGWKCKLLNISEVPSELNDLGSTIHNEEIGYRFEGGPSGLQEISVVYDNEDQEFVLNISARAILEIENQGAIRNSTPSKLTQLILNRAFEQQK